MTDQPRTSRPHTDADPAPPPDEAIAELHAERRRIAEAIRTYPGPIAGCDQQFNSLLERRQAVAATIARVEKGPKKG